MEIATWIVAGVLALLYLTAGTLKTTRPMAKLEPSMPWTTSLTTAQVRLLGTAELLGALGLVLPKLLGVVDERAGLEGTLTALAATGLALVQLGAIPLHLRRGEPAVLPMNVVLLLAAAFVAVVRFGWLG
ncbi:putative membrane protein [Marmoricola sp. URHA0025 HA25]